MSDQEPVAGAYVDITAPKTTYLDFRDTYGVRVVVRKSSAMAVATHEGTLEGPFVWVFATNPETGADASPHLNVEQARSIRDALDLFIEENSHDGNTAVDEDDDDAHGRNDLGILEHD